MIIRSAQRTYEVKFVSSVQESLTVIEDRDIVITDSNLDMHYGAHLPKTKLVIPSGEESKSLLVYEKLIRDLARLGTQRGDRVVAFGGGVVGDLAGFVAASYMRGIRLLQMPTSLLAMVDSSVGGKVGLDLPEGKNLVGAFYAPHEVVVCTQFLKTLPPRHFINGMAEVWKYGWIMDEPFLNQLESTVSDNLDHSKDDIVSRCIQLKNEVVTLDEFESSGLRATLNFGHTVGHAIESVTGYRSLLHGEAIAIGMVVETQLSERLGCCENGLSDRVRKGLSLQGLPVEIPPTIDREQLLSSMYLDKKADRAGLAFSLIEGPGRCKLVTGIEGDVVREVLGA